MNNRDEDILPEEHLKILHERLERGPQGPLIEASGAEMAADVMRRGRERLERQRNAA